MANRPIDMDDASFNELYERYVEPLNAETIFSNPTSMLIDLQRRYKLAYQFHGTYRGREYWSVVDENTYDGPESPIGTGSSPSEALMDLLEQIAAEVVKQ